MQGRKYHHGNLRPTLVQEAIRVIGNEGVEGLTLRRIARDIGVSHAAPYRHFKNLGALLAAVAEAGVSALDDALAVAAGADDPVTAMPEAYLSFARTNPGWFQLIFSYGDASSLAARFEAALGPTQRSHFGEALLCATHGLVAFSSLDAKAITGALIPT